MLDDQIVGAQLFAQLRESHFWSSYSGMSTTCFSGASEASLEHEHQAVAVFDTEHARVVGLREALDEFGAHGMPSSRQRNLGRQCEPGAPDHCRCSALARPAVFTYCREKAAH